MINIFSSKRPHGSAWCICCMSDEDTKQLQFSNDGRCGTSIILCRKCRKELMEKLSSLDSPKISVGDEVYILDDTDRKVVTALDGDSCTVMTCRGKFSVIKQSNLNKTGRHFQLEEFLRELEGVM